MFSRGRCTGEAACRRDTHARAVKVVKKHRDVYGSRYLLPRTLRRRGRSDDGRVRRRPCSDHGSHRGCVARAFGRDLERAEHGQGLPVTAARKGTTFSGARKGLASFPHPSELDADHPGEGCAHGLFQTMNRTRLTGQAKRRASREKGPSGVFHMFARIPVDSTSSTSSTTALCGALSALESRKEVNQS